MNSVIENEISDKSQSIFRNQNFFLLFTGKLISLLGDNIYLFALGWYVLSTTHSGAKMGLLLMIGAIPAVIISPLGGVIADKYNRKSVMVLMDLFRGILILAMVGLLYYQALEIWMLYTVTAILGICGAIFNPAATAIIPNIVTPEQLTSATSIDQFLVNTCAFIGMLAGGFLYSLLGISIVFIINAFSFIISALLEFMIALPSKPKGLTEKDPNKPRVRTIISELGAGFDFLLSHRDLLYLNIFLSLNLLLLVPCIMVYRPYLFNILLKSSPLELALVQSFNSAGLIIGSILITILPRKDRLRNSFLKGNFSIGFFLLLFAVPILPWILPRISTWSITIIYSLIAIVYGIVATLFNIRVIVLIQTRLSDNIRGRVWAIWGAIVTAVIPIAFLLGGYLAQTVPMYLLLIAHALGIFINTLMMARVKEIGEI